MAKYMRCYRSWNAQIKNLTDNLSEQSDNEELSESESKVLPHCSLNKSEVQNLDCEYYSESSSSDICDSDQTGINFKDKLQKWAVETEQTRATLNSLLEILRSESFSLPKDARTLIKSPKPIQIQQKCGGNYFYLGIARCIVEYLRHNQPEQCLKFDFFVDGLPLFKSSFVQLWPILCSD